MLASAMAARIDTAVILAAGMGTRLEQIGRMIPKGFLQFAEKPIVEESILKLRSFGVERVVVVTGHLPFFYEGLRQRYPDLITTVHNPAYEGSGSLYSLGCARDAVDGDFLLLESDIVFEKRAIAELLDDPDDSVVLLCDATESSDPVHVVTGDGLLVDMSKDRTALHGQVAGELVGVSKISRALFDTMNALLDESMPDAMTWHYEEDGLVGAARIVPVHCRVVDGLACYEIDDEHDIEVARERVLPTILQRDGAGADHAHP